MKCPDCGKDNRTGVLICEHCGNDLYDGLLERVSTKQIKRQGTKNLKLDEPPSSRPLLLYVQQDEAPLTIERNNYLIIGRIEPDSDELVDIDMEPFGGREQGVSRKHARLDARENPPVLIDLGSYNGTFVNGQKLTPQQPHELESGDEIRLGRLVTHLYYK